MTAQSPAIIRSSGLIMAYVVMLVTFGILDAVWLGMIADQWYFDSLAPVMREQFVIWPWIIFYLAYSAAALYLAVVPAGASVVQAFLKGAVVGATAYGAYNLTNYSIVANWPLPITLIDWAWGTLATAVVSASGSLAIKLKH